MLSTTLVVYLDDLLLLGTRYATAEEQGQDDTNDLYRENHNYNNSDYIKGLYEVCVCVCVCAYLKETNDDTNDTSSNGQSKKCIGIHTYTALGEGHT